LGGATSVSAFSPVVTEVAQPYDVVTIDEQAIKAQEYLGELSGFPIMYEVTSDEPFVLQAQVQQRYRAGAEPIAFSLIAIRQNERGGGVTEVARLSQSASDWQRLKDARLGFSLWTGSILSETVEPGTYRIEVSTPENLGKYLLSFGTADSDDSYVTSLAGVTRTQQFFGLSFFTLLASSYVYYPLGVIFLLFMMQRGWKYRTLITQNDT